MSQSNDQDLVTISLQKLVKLSSSLQYKEQLKVHRADWLSYFRQLSEMILYMPLHTVLALHFRQLLEPLLKAVSQLWKSSKFQDFSHEEIKNIENILQSIYQNSFHCFMKYERKGYNELVADLIKHKVINPQGKKYMNTSTRTLVIRKMLERLYQLSKMRSSAQNSLQSRKELNKFIEKQLLVEDPVNFLEQIVLNWIKNRVQFLQNEPKEYICCRIHFEHLATSNMSGFTEAADQEFKDYRWPLENESIKFHLVKTIVGYLNTTGGIIYVGLKQDKSKMVEVKGIKLTKQQKVKFLKFIHDDILNQVYPKELERRESEEKKESEYRKRLMEELNREKKSGYEYRINKYISIDFLDVYKKENYLNVQDLYVVRIKIKVGDQRELYHVINKKNIPETFLREDKSVRKKTIADFYDLFYDRMNSKSKITEKSDKHAYCRFQPLEDIERLEKHSELKKTERQWQ